MNGTDAQAHSDNDAPHIEVSSNVMSAILVLPSRGSSLPLSSDSIYELLDQAGITHGAIDGIIVSFDKKQPEEERITIARGTPPENGADGTIEFHIPTTTTVKVTKDSEIAVVHPPGEGKNGMTVRGAEIPASAGKGITIPALENIDRTDNGTILKAKIDGYFSKTQKTLSIRPFFKLDISPDNLEASVIVAHRIDKADFGPEELHELLKNAEITFGILEDEIERVFVESIYDTPVTIARGKKLVDGRDGFIEHLFDLETKPEMDDQGNVNYKEINLIKNVRTGDTIARLIPPVPGKNGCTIFGVESKAKEGVKPQFSIGKNTETDPSDEDALLATIDGSVRLNSGKIEVDEVYTVQKNVDYSTGNIKFIGSVEVNGDVKAGFRIIAKGDVQINGLVEDAIIDCEGNVLIKRGFIGHGNGYIIAGGTVQASFCENEHIIADGDIDLESFAMNADIQTRGKLTVTGKKGLLLGGSYFAVRGIEINNAGSEHSEPTLLNAGVDRVLRTRLSNIEKEIALINTLLVKNMRRRLVKKEMPPRLKKIIGKLREHMEKKEEERTHILEEIDALDDKQEEFAKATVIVNDTTYPGTIVSIASQRHMVRDKRESVKFIMDDNGYIDEIPLK